MTKLKLNIPIGQSVRIKVKSTTPEIQAYITFYGGPKGKDGYDSAYASAVAGGYTGTQEQFQADLATISKKITAVEGLGLSECSYSKDEKEKLSGIEEKANNYKHPDLHPASMIEESTTRLFYTSGERDKLKGIEENANNYTHPDTHPASMIEESTFRIFYTPGEREKLRGIQENANNYIHPAIHPASMIEEDSTHRFMSDSQIIKLHDRNTDYQLITPDGSKIVLSVDNAGNVIISGNIIQNGDSYITHAEELRTQKNIIVLRDGAVSGLGTNEFVGLLALLYDGINNGQLIFDSKGVARVGDVGDEKPLALREESPIDKFIQIWNADKQSLESVDPDELPVSKEAKTELSKKQSILIKSLNETEIIDWDLSDASTCILELTASHTINFPTGLKPGSSYRLIVKQLNEGNFTLEFRSPNYKFSSAPLIWTPAGTVSILYFFAESEEILHCTKIIVNSSDKSSFYNTWEPLSY
jgi:hypothetical protein